MNYLYAPWRSNYIVNDKQPDPATQACIFCTQFADTQDEKNFIIKRFENVVVMLNLYPYNPGHLLILPYEHHASLESLSPETRLELINVVSHSVQILQTTLASQGTNVGINLGGKAAGGTRGRHGALERLGRIRRHLCAHPRGSCGARERQGRA